MLAALATLAPRQRAVVVLRHFLDLDVAETARRPRLHDRHRQVPERQGARPPPQHPRTHDHRPGARMNDLNTLLERAAGPTATPRRRARRPDPRPPRPRPDPAPPRRPRPRGGRRRRRGGRRDGTVRRRRPRPSRGRRPQTTAPGARAGITFLAQPFEAGPYTFDQTPAGWEVQGANAYAVTIAPVGFPDQEPLSFIGKLVILFDGNTLERLPIEHDGRTSGSARARLADRRHPHPPQRAGRRGRASSTPTTPAGPATRCSTFLAGVHVGPGAQQGVG